MDAKMLKKPNESPVSNDYVLQTMSPVQYPPIQVMERPGDFDPDRPSTQVDWSIHSNDSLFSIQIGNTSFSKEQFLLMNGDVRMSEEWYNSRELHRSGELNKSSSGRPHPSPIRKPPRIEIPNVGKKSEKTEVACETMIDSTIGSVVDQVEEKMPQLEGAGKSLAVNGHSYRSRTTGQSFAFPVKKRSGWRLCHCCCSWAFCNCTWPSCSCFHFKWPNCLCCHFKWPSCSCCRRPSWSCCHFKWSSCSCCQFKLPSCSCFHFKWSCFKCQCSNHSWAFFSCWNFKRKKLCPYSPDKTLTDNGASVFGKGLPEQLDSKPRDSGTSPEPKNCNIWCSSIPSCSCSLCHCRCWC